TWNVWGRAADYETRYRDILHELESVSADVVGLVEVWRDGDELQIRSIAEALGYPHWSYAELMSGRPGDVPWGVGTLSRLPIEAERHFVFPNAMRIDLEAPGVVLLTTLRSEVGLFEFACLCEWGLGWSPYGVDGTSDRLGTYQFLT